MHFLVYHNNSLIKKQLKAWLFQRNQLNWIANICFDKFCLNHSLIQK
jgi:hypothetical protein